MAAPVCPEAQMLQYAIGLLSAVTSAAVYLWKKLATEMREQREREAARADLERERSAQIEKLIASRDS